MNIGYIRILLTGPAAEKIRKIEEDQNKALTCWRAFAAKFGASESKIRISQTVAGWMRMSGLIFDSGKIPEGWEKTVDGVCMPAHTNKQPGKGILAEMENLPAAPCNLTVGQYVFGLSDKEVVIRRGRGEMTQRFNLDRIGDQNIVTAFVGGDVEPPLMTEGCQVIRESEYWRIREEADLKTTGER